jgi:phosphinothricin acetyltransferase
MSPTAPPESNSPRHSDVRVRAACNADAFDVARIYNQHVDVGGTTFDNVHWTTEKMHQLLEAGKPEGWYVAVQDDAVIGWANVRRYSLRYGYRFSCETGIYLDQSAIGRGVGDVLQSRIEEHCRECSIHHAVAKIVADNQRSMAFHYRRGYELVGIQKEIGQMDGKWVDVVILQKIFAGS